MLACEKLTWVHPMFVFTCIFGICHSEQNLVEPGLVLTHFNTWVSLCLACVVSAKGKGKGGGGGGGRGGGEKI